ncbi:MAG: CHAT domain-containing protein [Pyrinomonadaceae bacterium]
MFEIKTMLTIVFVILFLVFAINAQPSEVTEILPNQKFEREISENVSHQFLIKAKSGDFMRVIVDQKNADVKIKLLNSAGQKIYEVDNSNSREELERASLIVENTGELSLEISFVKKLTGKAEGKDYGINLEVLQPTNDQDLILIKAERLYDEATRMRLERKAESRQNSIKVFQEAARLFAQIEDRLGLAFVYYSLGQVNSLLTNLEESRNNHSKAAAIFLELNLRPQYARTITDQAAAYFFERNLDQSEKLCLEALRVFEELGDRRGEAEITGNLGAIFDAKDNPRLALEYYFRALPILQSEKDKVQEGSILSRIGSVYDDLGEPFQALEYYEMALKIRRELKDERTEATTLANMSVVLKNLGYYDRAIEASERAFQIFSQIGQKYGEAATLNSLGNLNNDLNENEKAIEFYERALTIIREVKLRDNEAATLLNIANINLLVGNTQGSLKLFKDGLQIFRELKNKRGESRALVKIGEAYLKTGDSQQALEYFNQALPIFREIEDRSWEAATMFLIGEANRETGSFPVAKKFYLDALRIRRELKETSDEAQNLLALAKVEKELNNFAASQSQIENAIKILENTRANISRRNLRNSYFAAKQDFYDFYINLLVERHKKEPLNGYDSLAFEISERARARSLLESLGESRFDIRAGVSSETLKKEKNLRQTINAKDTLRLNALNARQAEKSRIFENEINELLRQYSEVQTKIRAESPQFASLIQPEILSLTKFQAEVLDEHSVLLEYSLGEEHSFLFVVDKSSLSIFELPKRVEIEKAVRKFVENIRAYGNDSLRETSRQNQSISGSADANRKVERENLSRMLLGSAIKKLKDNRLLIVASGILQYVPFTALANPNAKNSFLIETNEIVMLPSVSVLQALRNNKREIVNRPGLMAILADPVFAVDDTRVKTSARQKTDEKPVPSSIAANDIPRQLRSDFSRLRFSRREAEEIAKFMPEDQRFLAMDFDANMKIAKGDDLQKAKFVHFATHGVINSDFPELSGIVLSLVDEDGKPQDGFLRLHDIYNMRLNADLVVLSACDSALGKEIKGEGIIGLTRGFMYAGSPSVIASLWKVEDRATAELMKRFYRAMLKDKQKPVNALRTAQIEMLKNKRWQNPFYWAAFTLQGEWK